MSRIKSKAEVPSFGVSFFEVADIPEWIRWRSDEPYGAYLLVRERCVYVRHPTKPAKWRSPVWIVYPLSYTTVRMLTVDELRLIARKGWPLDLHQREPVTVAPQWAIDGGVDLDAFGLGKYGRPQERVTTSGPQLSLDIP